MLEHGGRLRQAASKFGIPYEQWLDLSTGVSPFSYAVGEIPQRSWHYLPEEEDGLERAAREYYQTQHILPVSGSQAAIQALPRLRALGTVGLFHPSYNEHAHAWRRHGHTVRVLDRHADMVAACETLDVVLVCNPNNPTGHLYQPEELMAWHHMLSRHGGWLIVDEAFIDVTPEASIAPRCGSEGLIVLRSLGKFFGLAGARVGFVGAWTALLGQLREELGPWTISGPARFAAQMALSDNAWHDSARQRLQAAAQSVAETLVANGVKPTASTPFFHWWQSPHAAALHHKLSEHGILTRLFAEPESVRFGLAASDAELQRLAQALADCAKTLGYAGAGVINNAC